jgi:hypothetical protein
MLNKNKRDKNKSQGPWGLTDYIVAYKKTEDGMERTRFITATSTESAGEQLSSLLKKEGFTPIIISILKE